MDVGEDQLHARQAAGAQGAARAGPEGATLRIPNLDTEAFTLAVGGHPDRDHDRLGHVATVEACLPLGGIQEHVRVGVSIKVPFLERDHLFVEVGADPRHLGLAGPRRHP